MLLKRLLGYNLSLNTKNEGKKEEKCRKSEWQHVFIISLVTFTIRLIVVGNLWNEKMHIELKKTFKQHLPNSTQNYIVLRRCKFGNWMNWFIFVSEMLNLFYWFINITCNQNINKTTMMFCIVLVDIDISRTFVI